MTRVQTVGFGCENSVLIFCSITAVWIFAIGLYNAPACLEAVSSDEKEMEELWSNLKLDLKKSS